MGAFLADEFSRFLSLTTCDILNIIMAHKFLGNTQRSASPQRNQDNLATARAKLSGSSGFWERKRSLIYKLRVGT